MLYILVQYWYYSSNIGRIDAASIWSASFEDEGETAEFLNVFIYMGCYVGLGDHNENIIIFIIPVMLNYLNIF